MVGNFQGLLSKKKVLTFIFIVGFFYSYPWVNDTGLCTQHACICNFSNLVGTFETNTDIIHRWGNFTTIYFDVQVRDGLDMEERDEDVPTEEQIERMEERLEEAQGQQKNLFLIIFQVQLFSTV